MASIDSIVNRVKRAQSRTAYGPNASRTTQRNNNGTSRNTNGRTVQEQAVKQAGTATRQTSGRSQTVTQNRQPRQQTNAVNRQQSNNPNIRSFNPKATYSNYDTLLKANEYRAKGTTSNNMYENMAKEEKKKQTDSATPIENVGRTIGNTAKAVGDAITAIPRAIGNRIETGKRNRSYNTGMSDEEQMEIARRDFGASDEDIALARQTYAANVDYTNRNPMNGNVDFNKIAEKGMRDISGLPMDSWLRYLPDHDADLLDRTGKAIKAGVLQHGQGIAGNIMDVSNFFGNENGEEEAGKDYDYYRQLAQQAMTGDNRNLYDQVVASTAQNTLTGLETAALSALGGFSPGTTTAKRLGLANMARGAYGSSYGDVRTGGQGEQYADDVAAARRYALGNMGNELLQENLFDILGGVTGGRIAENKIPGADVFGVGDFIPEAIEEGVGAGLDPFSQALLDANPFTNPGEYLSRVGEIYGEQGVGGTLKEMRDSALAGGLGGVAGGMMSLPGQAVRQFETDKNAYENGLELFSAMKALENEERQNALAENAPQGQIPNNINLDLSGALADADIKVPAMRNREHTAQENKEIHSYDMRRQQKTDERIEKFYGKASENNGETILKKAFDAYMNDTFSEDLSDVASKERSENIKVLRRALGNGALMTSDPVIRNQAQKANALIIKDSARRQGVNVDEQTLNDMIDISNYTGVPFEFLPDEVFKRANAGGAWFAPGDSHGLRTGVIQMPADVSTLGMGLKESLVEVYLHEVTHSTEGTPEYMRLKNALMELDKSAFDEQGNRKDTTYTESDNGDVIGILDRYNEYTQSDEAKSKLTHDYKHMHGTEHVSDLSGRYAKNRTEEGEPYLQDIVKDDDLGRSLRKFFDDLANNKELTDRDRAKRKTTRLMHDALSASKTAHNSEGLVYDPKYHVQLQAALNKMGENPHPLDIVPGTNGMTVRDAYSLIDTKRPMPYNGKREFDTPYDLERGGRSSERFRKYTRDDGARAMAAVENEHSYEQVLNSLNWGEDAESEVDWLSDELYRISTKDLKRSADYDLDAEAYKLLYEENDDLLEGRDPNMVKRVLDEYDGREYTPFSESELAKIRGASEVEREDTIPDRRSIHNEETGKDENRELGGSRQLIQPDGKMMGNTVTDVYRGLIEMNKANPSEELEAAINDIWEHGINAKSLKDMGYAPASTTDVIDKSDPRYGKAIDNISKFKGTYEENLEYSKNELKVRDGEKKAVKKSSRKSDADSDFGKKLTEIKITPGTADKLASELEKKGNFNNSTLNQAVTSLAKKDSITEDEARNKILAIKDDYLKEHPELVKKPVKKAKKKTEQQVYEETVAKTEDAKTEPVVEEEQAEPIGKKDRAKIYFDDAGNLRDGETRKIIKTNKQIEAEKQAKREAEEQAKLEAYNKTVAEEQTPAPVKAETKPIVKEEAKPVEEAKEEVQTKQEEVSTEESRVEEETPKEEAKSGNQVLREHGVADETIKKLTDAMESGKQKKIDGAERIVAQELLEKNPDKYEGLDEAMDEVQQLEESLTPQEQATTEQAVEETKAEEKPKAEMKQFKTREISDDVANEFNSDLAKEYYRYGASIENANAMAKRIIETGSASGVYEDVRKDMMDEMGVTSDEVRTITSTIRKEYTAKVKAQEAEARKAKYEAERAEKAEARAKTKAEEAEAKAKAKAEKKAEQEKAKAEAVKKTATEKTEKVKKAAKDFADKKFTKEQEKVIQDAQTRAEEIRQEREAQQSEKEREFYKKTAEQVKREKPTEQTPISDDIANSARDRRKNATDYSSQKTMSDMLSDAKKNPGSVSESIQSRIDESYKEKPVVHDKDVMSEIRRRINEDGLDTAVRYANEISYANAPISEESVRYMEEAFFMANQQSLDAETKINDFASTVKANGYQFGTKGFTKNGKTVTSFVGKDGKTYDYKSWDSLKNEQKVSGDQAGALLEAFCETSSEAGRIFRALQFAHNNPLAAASYLKRIVNRLNRQYADQLKGKEVKLDPALEKEYINAKDEKERSKIMEKINVSLADQLPRNAGDMIRQWRMTMMLMNPRTHMRNILSNGLTYGLFKTSDLVQSGLENVALNWLGENGIKAINYKQSDRRATVLIEKDFADVAKWLDSRDLYSKEKPGDGKFNLWQGKMGAGSFSNKNIVGKAINGTSKLNIDALQAEDEFFVKARAHSAMAQMLQTQGYKVAKTKDGYSITKNNKAIDDVVLKAMEKAALQSAQEATYHDFNEMAAALEDLKKKGGIFGKGLDIIVPFTKTPANIMRRSKEFSPIGLAQAMTTDLYKVKTGQMSASTYLTRLSRGMTGTMLFMVGAFFANIGRIKKPEDDDEYGKTSYYRNNIYGTQDFALHIGDRYYSIDWAMPTTAPIILGAAMANEMQKHGLNFFDYDKKELLKAFGKGMGPILEASYLGSLADFVEDIQQGAKYGGEYAPNELPGAVERALSSVAENLAGQMVPTFGGALRRTFDETKRTTSGNTALERVKNRTVMNFAPAKYLLGDLEPAVDQKGQPLTNLGLFDDSESGFVRGVGRFLYNTVVPMTITEDTHDEIDDKLMEAGSVALPRNQTGSGGLKGQIYGDFKEAKMDIGDLSDEEYTKVKQIYYGNYREYAKDYTELASYNNLGTYSRDNVYEKLEDLALREAKEVYYDKVGDVKDLYTNEQKAALALKERGISPAQFFLIKQNGLSGNRKGLYVMSELEALGVADEVVQDILDGKYYASSVGLTDSVILKTPDEREYAREQYLIDDKYETLESQAAAYRKKSNEQMKKEKEKEDEQSAKDATAELVEKYNKKFGNGGTATTSSKKSGKSNKRYYGSGKSSSKRYSSRSSSSSTTTTLSTDQELYEKLIDAVRDGLETKSKAPSATVSNEDWNGEAALWDAIVNGSKSDIAKLKKELGL